MYRRGRILVIFLLGILLIGSKITNACAEEKDERLIRTLPVEVDVDVAINSKYIWRGFALDIDPVFQPSVSLTGYDLTFTFWSSWDFDNNDDLNGDEIDYVVDYSCEFDNFSVSLGHTYYEFPGTDTFSRELYGSIGLSAIPLTPTFTYYYDYGDEEQGGADGEYMTLELSHSFIIEGDLGITLDLTVRAGYNRELFINGEGGDGLLSTGLTIPLNKSLSFSPNINYVMPYGDLDDPGDGNQRDRFYYGFGLLATF